MILAQREMLAEREAALSEAQNDAKVRALESTPPRSTRGAGWRWQ